MHSTYTQGLLDTPSHAQRMIPQNWESLLKTVTESGAYMQFKTWWENEAKQQAKKIKKTMLQLSWNSCWGLDSGWGSGTVGV